MVYVNEMTGLLPNMYYGAVTAVWKLKGKEGEGLETKKVVEKIFFLQPAATILP
ncbi:MULTISPECIES: hypothetical protein [Peribacillus]|uniref:hypothetical protein n=1 Tax=Peribacillus TaxID=2675229 RepID=UPI0020404EC2|nr:MULTISPECIES: hypothetical protein [Peribacillus]MCM3675855.1 hypothetical protein [Peribacillus simplex]MDQ0880551.1 hypothetical protein [Peribacillus sp. V2I11]